MESMTRSFEKLVRKISLQKGCTIILFIYLFGNFATVFTCVSIYTIGDSLFLTSSHKNVNKLITFDGLISYTWNYSLIFIFITSCQREFMWVSIAAIGMNILAIFAVILEVPALMVPFLIYEISVNTFFAYVKILWCVVYGLAIHAPIEFIIFLIRIYFWLILLNYCVRLYKNSKHGVSSLFHDRADSGY